MANNFLQFSETLDALTPEESAWLGHQLEPIAVINGTEYPQDDDAVRNRDTEPSYQGLRFLRDYEDLEDGDADVQGFEVEYQGDDTTYAWFSAEANGDPVRLAHLVQKFLKRFRPDQCWSLTYATTCSKLRLGEFGGGAVFVTADEIFWQNADDFVEQHGAAFENAKENAASPRPADADERIPVEPQCAESPTGRHMPDPQSIRPADGAGRNRGTDWLIDVNCIHCGRGGSMRIDQGNFLW